MTISALFAVAEGRIEARARVLAAEPSPAPISELTPYIDAGLLHVEPPVPENGNVLQLEWIAN